MAQRLYFKALSLDLKKWPLTSYLASYHSKVSCVEIDQNWGPRSSFTLVSAQQKHNFTQNRCADEKLKMVCKGKTFAHHPMHICVSVFAKEIILGDTINVV